MKQIQIQNLQNNLYEKIVYDIIIPKGRFIFNKNIRLAIYSILNSLLSVRSSIIWMIQYETDNNTSGKLS